MALEQKTETIVRFAQDLFEMAAEYNRMVSILHNLPDAEIDYLYRIAMSADSLFGELADEKSEAKTLGGFESDD